MVEKIDDLLDGLLVPWHWDHIQMTNELDGLPMNWCEDQGWQFGVDYYYVVTDAHPAYTTEWGRFKINKNRIYNYLFKNPNHGTMFRLRWSHEI